MTTKHKYCWSILTGMLLVLGLWTISLYNYLLFHGIAELFSIVVACGIFMFAWSSRQFIKNSYFLFIGIAYLFVGNLDLVHTIAYKGMGILPGYEANLSTQLWIATRYVEGVSLLIAPFFIGRKLKTNFVLLGYIITTAVLLGSILYWHIFPACFIEGEGLTVFKKVSEYIISLILLASVVALFNKRKEFERNILRLLIASVVITIASELAFTFYVDAYGFSNLVGHYLKIISFYLIYIAVIKTGLTRPYALFFRDIKRSEEELLIKDEAIASSITAIGITDLHGKLVYVNNSLVKMWGYDNDGEILGRFLPEFWEGEGIFETLKKLREKGTRVGEDIGKRRDGSLFHVHFSASMIKDKTGSPVFMFGSFTDITSRKEAEEALKDSEEKFRTLVGNIPDAVWTTDRKGNTTFISANILDIYGYSPEEIYANPKQLWFERIHPDDVRDVKRAFERFFETSDRFDIQYRIRHKNGHWIWLHNRSTAIYRKDGVYYSDGVLTDITERKQAEEVLHQSEEKYRGIFNESVAAVYVFDEKKHFVDSNQAGLDLLGYSRDELLSMGIPDVDADPVVVLPAHEQLLSGDKIVNYEHQLRRKDGTIITVLNNSRPLTDTEGNVIGMQSTLIDTTKRKQAQERLSAIVYKSPIPTAVGGIDGSIIAFNEALENLIGYKASEIGDISGWVRKLYPDEEYREFVWKNIKQALDGKEQDCTEFTITCKDGSIRTVEFHTSFFEDGLVVQMVDITERKKVEESLSEKEREERALIDSVGDSLFLMFPDSTIIVTNQGLADQFGKQASELVGTKALDLFPGSLSKERMGYGEKVIATGQALTVTDARAGRFIESRIFPVKNDHGTVVKLAVYSRDITEEKLAKESLKKSEEKFRALITNIPDVVWTTDSNGNTAFISSNIHEIYGYSPEEIYSRPGKLWLDRIHHEDVERVEHAFRALFETGSRFDVEYRIKSKNGDWIWLHDRSIATYQKDGVMYADGVLTDVTERKQAEEELSKSHMKLSKAEQIANVGFLEWDLNTNEMTPSGGAYSLYGLDPKMPVTMDQIVGLVHPDDSEIVEDNLNMAIQGIRDYNIDHRMVRPDGKVIWVHARADLERDSEGIPVSLIGTVVDITDRKRDEERILGLAHILETSLNEVYIFDAQTLRFVQVNEGARKNVGYSMEELQELTPLDIKPEFSMETFSELAELLHKGREEIVIYETIHERKDGSLYPVEVHLQLSRLENRSVFVAIVLDITGRKQAELAVREMASFAELNPAPVLRVNSDGLIMSCNPALGELLGKNIEEATFLRSVLPDLSEITLSDCIRGGLLLTHESYIQGRYFQFVFRGIPDMSLVYIYGSDITKRKQMEKALQISETNLVKAQEVARIGSWHLDLLENNLVWTDENYKIFGVSKGTPMTYEKFLEVVHPEDRDYVDKKWRAATEDEPYDIEHRLLIDNEVKWVREKAELNFDDKGNATSAIGITQDITERKRAEKKLNQYQQRLKALASELTVAGEQERRRIAADLHDNVGQLLAFARLRMAAAQRTTSRTRLAAILEEISESLLLAIKDTRSLVFDLSSPSLNEIGLAAAIAEWLEEQIQKRHALKTEFIDECGGVRLDDNVRAILFRSVRELLANVVKHAKASQVAVCLKRMGGCLEIIVRDNGVGFDYAVESGTQIGFGLFSIQERMADLGGSLEIESKPGKGCKIIMRAPLNTA